MKTLLASVTIVLSLLLAAVPPAEAKSRKAGSITLQFIPQESTGFDHPVLMDGVVGIPVVLTFEDGRSISDLTVVGEGQRDDDSMFPVHATNDVGEFARELLMQHGQEWGIQFSPAAERVLQVRLTRFFVRESDKAVGSMYRAEAGLAAKLSAIDGATLWEGTAAGDATRYGKSDSNENRNEVLSDAIKESFAHLFGNEGLQRAWLGQPVPRAEESAAPAPVARGAPSDLLAKVVHLRDEGLSEELLLSFIRQHEPIRAFTTDDVLAWNASGLSEQVIAAAMERAK